MRAVLVLAALLALAFTSGVALATDIPPGSTVLALATPQFSTDVPVYRYMVEAFGILGYAVISEPRTHTLDFLYQFVSFSDALTPPLARLGPFNIPGITSKVSQLTSNSSLLPQLIAGESNPIVFYAVPEYPSASVRRVGTDYEFSYQFPSIFTQPILIQTNAKAYTTGYADLTFQLDPTTVITQRLDILAPSAAFIATPEPASLSLLVGCLLSLGIGSALKRRFPSC
jgi:hypothetical protein